MPLQVNLCFDLLDADQLGRAVNIAMGESNVLPREKVALRAWQSPLRTVPVATARALMTL
jgi:hypothetical protein